MIEYCLKGETKDGKILMVRRGFVSRLAAQEYPIKSSFWKRVWVEPWAPPAFGQKSPVPTYKERVDLCFQAIVDAAIKGHRCPENGSHGVNTQRCRALANAGDIKIEVFARNYRVVTILTGRHAGLKTAPPPYKVAQPKLVINKDGKHVFKRFDHGARVVVYPAART
jgi:hypothetical protein